jgi:hypothetical protein
MWTAKMASVRMPFQEQAAAAAVLAEGAVAWHPIIIIIIYSPTDKTEARGHQEHHIYMTNARPQLRPLLLLLVLLLLPSLLRLLLLLLLSLCLCVWFCGACVW